jgi:hypothetical protein
MQKERRHEYETVWVDSEGNELEEPPDDAPAAPRERRSDPRKPQPKRPQQRGAGATRLPPPPSWRRSAKRSLILGGFVLVGMYLLNSKAKGASRVGTAVELAVFYTVIFTLFTYGVDRFAYRRYLRRTGQAPAKR